MPDPARPPGRPELLAPAGDWECVHAAAANGADAVYFGLQKFNARLRAHNFQTSDAPALMAWLHARGMRGLVAFNTLVFQHELPDAARFIEEIAEAGADAIIVQDLGLCALAREVAPGLPIHASTQMTLTSPEGLRFAAGLGVSRAVLARELSLREIRKFAPSSPLPLEVFVHGALCVAYSGQCLTSEALGQRSANRGECAQACRLPYTLIADGQTVDLGDKKYLLSPQDLAAVAEIPELLGLGIAAFKIEGRLKSPEYVAATTQVYRRAIDAALAGAHAAANDPEERYRLEMAFSRGLFSGWLHGVNHQKLVHARFGKKRGAFVGEVISTARDHVRVKIGCEVKPGDGLVFDTGGDTDREQGGRLYALRGDALFFENNRLDFSRIPPGTKVWKTDDPALARELRKTFATPPQPRPLPVRFRAVGRVGAPLQIEAVAGDRHASAASAIPLQPAVNRPLTEASLRDQLGRLGGSGFALESVDCAIEGDAILPVSEINRLRRALVEQLAASAHPTAPTDSTHACAEPRFRAKENPTGQAPTSAHRLAVLCRRPDQAMAAAEAGCARLYLDFEDIRRYQPCLEEIRSRHPSAAVWLATPRIQKAGEEGFFRLIAGCKPDGVLVRNLGGLDFFKEIGLPMAGDFSLNCTNARTAELLLASGLGSATVSFDLNGDQVLDLLRAAPPHWFEIAIHLHMPMFHMEHCVFAAFLSSGTDHTDCGRPCDRHRVQLEDRVGARHPLTADVGCRNTLFHAKAQTGAKFFTAFAAAGARLWRVELLGETPQESAEVVRAYAELIAGRADALALSARLRAVDQLGVTSGTLTVLG